MTSRSAVPSSAVVLSALATIGAGVGMSLQGAANGELGTILGGGILAATVSFVTGLAILSILALALPGARAGVRTAWRLVRTGEFPWWMTLGGFAGATVVISQAITVPLLGVAVFTMSFVSGQLAGALVVDRTDLPPGGRRRLTAGRLIGTAVVIVGVALAAGDVLAQGIPVWAPAMPFVAGASTALQQAFNGRLRRETGSAIAATFTNFLTGSVLLVVCSAIAMAAGLRIAALPQMPGELWTLVGGALGIVFIGVTTVTVARLGVLLLSLMALFGNLAGSLAIDLTFHSAEAGVGAVTFVSMAVVAVGVAITTIPARATHSRME